MKSSPCSRVCECRGATEAVSRGRRTIRSETAAGAGCQLAGEEQLERSMVLGSACFYGFRGFGMSAVCRMSDGGGSDWPRSSGERRVLPGPGCCECRGFPELLGPVEWRASCTPGPGGTNWPSVEWRASCTPGGRVAASVVASLSCWVRSSGERRVLPDLAARLVEGASVVNSWPEADAVASVVAHSAAVEPGRVASVVYSRARLRPPG